VKAALTFDQVRALGLRESYQRAKHGSARADAMRQHYVAKYRTDHVYEIEAVLARSPNELQRLLREAIEGVIDRKAFNREVAKERAERTRSAQVREIVLRTLREEIES
jgi:TfoX/Sxy family transcriptional regulator of competence genes